MNTAKHNDRKKKKKPKKPIPLNHCRFHIIYISGLTKVVKMMTILKELQKYLKREKLKMSM